VRWWCGKDGTGSDVLHKLVEKVLLGGGGGVMR